MSVRYPPWDPKARLHLHVGCPYCWDDDPGVACGCPCHEEDREDGGDAEDEGSMEEFAAYLVNDPGYSRNECPGHCPHKAVEHAHLHSHGNPASIGIPPADFILWEDGTAAGSDPTQGPDRISEVDKL